MQTHEESIKRLVFRSSRSDIEVPKVMLEISQERERIEKGSVDSKPGAKRAKEAL